MVTRFVGRAAGTAAFIACVMVGTACASSRTRVFVRVGPPAPVVEARVVAPGAGWVWVPGYYAWDGVAYVWTPGSWRLPPSGRRVWVAPHWQQERRGWFFVEGHWR